MRYSGMLFFFVAVLLADSVAGLKWSAPSGWTSQGRTNMRAATYVLPAAPGDEGTAECVVYFFGVGQGGSVEANIDRWKGQFTELGGKPATAKVSKRTVHNLPVTMIESSGDYSGMGGPMAQTPALKHRFSLLGAIVEGPGGTTLFVKFVGPEKTVAANRRHFEELVASFEKE
jgi:hypothetical protein